MQIFHHEYTTYYKFREYNKNYPVEATYNLIECKKDLFIYSELIKFLGLNIGNYYKLYKDTDSKERSDTISFNVTQILKFSDMLNSNKDSEITTNYNKWLNNELEYIYDLAEDKIEDSYSALLLSKNLVRSVSELLAFHDNIFQEEDSFTKKNLLKNERKIFITFNYFHSKIIKMQEPEHYIYSIKKNIKLDIT